ncbi:MAG: EAL domain-containing protein [Pseudomonadota bacterium]|nr:EAL domain-containing protein [Pseudomonadota bacterium]
MQVLIFATVILVSSEASRMLTVEDLPMSLIWPASGLMIGAGLVMGWPMVLVATVSLACWLFFFEGRDVLASTLLAGSEGLGALAALAFLARKAGPQTALQTSQRERTLYLSAGALAATVTAGSGSLFLVLGDTGMAFRIHDAFMFYWLLEALGILLFAPLAYYFLLNRHRFVRICMRDFGSRWGLVWIVTTLCLIVAVRTMPEVTDRTYALALSFAFFPLMCWFALTAAPASTLVVMPCFAVLFVYFGIHGLGGIPRIETLNEALRVLLLLAGLILLIQVISVMNFTRNQLLETFRQQANTDFLSGLNNDRSFAHEIRKEVEGLVADTSDPRPSWLVYLQILDFDHVEDLMGYRASRNLEALLAARLMGTCGPDYRPARIGNGVFCLLVSRLELASLRPFLTRIYEAFDDEVFSTDGQQTRVRVSMGAVKLLTDVSDHGQYLSAATQSALMARDRLPRIQVVEDVPGMMVNRRGMTQRLELLKNALSNDHLALFAQPICPIGKTDEQLYYEILVRLRDPNGDFLPPGVFLPIAEAYGFMRQIDQWVVRNTLNRLASQPDWLSRTRKCSINLAGVSLSSEDTLEVIVAAFRDSGVPPEKVAFEVTETQQIRSREVAEKVTRGLRELGCSVSLDDFGTGLATFDYLKSFQFDTLKIDGAFIKEIATSLEDRQIVRSMCDVARGMGLKTVAEFVENQDVVSLLQELGVDYGPGFGLGRPAPLENLFHQHEQADRG